MALNKVISLTMVVLLGWAFLMVSSAPMDGSHEHVKKLLDAVCDDNIENCEAKVKSCGAQMQPKEEHKQAEEEKWKAAVIVCKNKTASDQPKQTKDRHHHHNHKAMAKCMLEETNMIVDGSINVEFMKEQADILNFNNEETKDAVVKAVPTCAASYKENEEFFKTFIPCMMKACVAATEL